MVDLLLSGTWRIRPTVDLSPAIGYSERRTHSPRFSNRSRRLRAGINVALPRGFSMGGSAQIRWTDFPDYQFFGRSFEREDPHPHPEPLAPQARLHPVRLQPVARGDPRESATPTRRRWTPSATAPSCASCASSEPPPGAASRPLVFVFGQAAAWQPRRSAEN